MMPFKSDWADYGENIVEFFSKDSRDPPFVVEAVDDDTPLYGGGGGGTSEPMTDDPLKPRVDFLQTAFLWLAGAIVTVALAVAGLVLTVSSSTNARTDKVADSVSNLSRETGVIGTKVDDTNHRLDQIDKKLDEISAKIK